MPINLPALVIAAGFVLAASAQDSERILTLNYIESEKELQEAATLIRALGEIQAVSTNTAEKAVIVKGNANQIKLAEWLAGRLNQPANSTRFGLATPDPNKQELPMGADDIVRVFYVDQAQDVRQLQEVAALTRAIVEMRRLFTYGPLRVVAIRGTAEEVRMAEWLLPQLNPLNRRAPDYRSPAPDGVLRVLLFPKASTVNDLQEVATFIRATAEIRRLFTFNAARAIAVRGTEEQIRLAQWLIDEFNQQRKASESPVRFAMSGPDDQVAVLYAENAPQVADLQEIAVTVRSVVRLRRLFTFNAPRAIVVRGSAAQLQMAEWLVRKLNNPAVAENRAAKHEYPARDDDDVVRVFYLEHALEPARMQEIAVTVRTTSQVPTLFTSHVPHAFTLRGSGEQIASAERLLRELDKAQ